MEAMPIVSLLWVLEMGPEGWADCVGKAISTKWGDLCSPLCCVTSMGPQDASVHSFVIEGCLFGMAETLECKVQQESQARALAT